METVTLLIYQKLQAMSSLSFWENKSWIVSSLLRNLFFSNYYSVFHSSPGVSHDDQLTWVVRYVLPTGPVERYILFRDVWRICRKTPSNGINIAEGNCMTNRVTRMECSVECRHTSSCNPALKQYTCRALRIYWILLAKQQFPVVFFDFVDSFVFFTESTSRWTISQLLFLTKKRLPVVKRLSDTRCSAHADATIAQ